MIPFSPVNYREKESCVTEHILRNFLDSTNDKAGGGLEDESAPGVQGSGESRN